MNHFFSTSLLCCSAILISGVLQANGEYNTRDIANLEDTVSWEGVEEGYVFSENEVDPEERSSAGFFASDEPTHKGALHKVISISFEDTTVELEDGSKWSIQADDFEQTFNWAPHDVIVITPNSWNSIYDFRLYNQKKESSVAAGLSLMPINNGMHTHWILGIDYNNRIILLEDGSVWKSSFFSDSAIKNWKLNDIVIIGVNDSWFRGKKRNILINAEALNYASCNCVNLKSTE